MSSITVIPNGDIMLTNVDCQLACVFCTEGIAKRKRPLHIIRHNQSRGLLSRLIVGLQELIKQGRAKRGVHSAAIVDEFTSLIDQVQTDEVVLAAHDILEYDRLFELLDICEEHGKKVCLISPGLKLADPEFAQRIAGHISRFTITYLSDDPKTYRKLTGNDKARDLVANAIANLKALDVSFSVNYIATALNYQDLLDVSAFLLGQIDLGAFTLVNFIPEPAHLKHDPKITRLFVPFPALSQELVRFADKYRGTRKNLVLCHVPPCRLDEQVLTSGNIRYSPPSIVDKEVGLFRHRHCSSCQYEERCPFVFTAYHNTHPDEQFDFEKVNRNVKMLRG